MFKIVGPEDHMQPTSWGWSVKEWAWIHMDRQIANRVVMAPDEGAVKRNTQPELMAWNGQEQTLMA
jgi:hypothetical protein